MYPTRGVALERTEKRTVNKSAYQPQEECFLRTFVSFLRLVLAMLVNSQEKKWGKRGGKIKGGGIGGSPSSAFCPLPLHDGCLIHNRATKD